MSVKRTVARNMVWNWGGMGAHMLAGFVVAPFLVRQLGETGYGLWVLIASLTGYFDLLDLGLRGSLGRNIAYHRAKNDDVGVRRVISTGMGLLLIGAALVLLATLGAQYIFFDLFEVPTAVQPQVHLALWLIGINLACIFFNSVFDAVLWANQRFDWLNGIDIPTILLRVGLTFALVSNNANSLVTLGAITLLVTVLNGIAKVLVCFRLEPAMGFRFGFLSWDTATSLFDFGIWCFLLSITTVAGASLAPFLIGSLLSVSLVTPYSVAARLVQYIGSLLMSSTGVLTPLATAYHAEEKRDEQVSMFIHGSRACATLALFFVAFFLLMGDTFLWLWMRRELPFANDILTILLIGALLPLSQWVTYSLVLSMNRHRVWAIMSLIEMGLVAGLAYWLIPAYGVIGMGLCIAIPGTICHGLVQLIYACHLLKVPVLSYVWNVYLPALFVLLLPVGVLLGLLQLGTPETWFTFVLYGAAYGIVFVCVAAPVLVGVSQLQQIGTQVWHRFRTPSPSPKDSSTNLETSAKAEAAAESSTVTPM